MRHISLEGLLLGLDDLLSKRLPALQSFSNGAANVVLLTSYRDRIQALPAALRGRPLADELDTTDTRHDGFGAGLWFVTEAYLRLPDASPALVAAAKKIRAILIPTLEELTSSYATEADAAKKRKSDLASLKPELDLFPVAGGTLYGWAVSFIQAGEQLDTLLSERADVKDRKAAAALRPEAIGTLNRLRKSLAAEAKADPKLPADLDAQVFSYFDLLESTAAEKAAGKKKAAEKKAQQEAATPTVSAPVGIPAGSTAAVPATPA